MEDLAEVCLMMSYELVRGRKDQAARFLEYEQGLREVEGRREK